MGKLRPRGWMWPFYIFPSDLRRSQGIIVTAAAVAIRDYVLSSTVPTFNLKNSFVLHNKADAQGLGRNSRDTNVFIKALRMSDIVFPI